ncbi:hypothetical protein TNCV_1586661 [Trichonephila clavipes]|nr:hypothetical protein TNCV_1586661 [Trichonephila clavipes]
MILYGKTDRWLRVRPRKSKVAGSIPVEDDKFSGCESRRHVCHMMSLSLILEFQFGSAKLSDAWSRLQNGHGRNLVDNVLSCWIRILLPLKTGMFWADAHVKFVEAQFPNFGVGSGVPTQMSSLSFHRYPKL